MNRRTLLRDLESYLQEKLSHVVVGATQVTLEAGACYTISRLASEILCKLGYNCNPQRIEATLANWRARKIMEEQKRQGSSDIDEVYNRGGHILGIGYRSRGDYHYVVYFPDSKDIMDLTFGQVSRPQKDILCEAYWENAENLPKEIIWLKILKNDDEWEKKTLYFHPVFQHYTQNIIQEGYELLKSKFQR